MRLLFKLIIFVYIVVFIVGLLIIIDRLLRRRQVEYHYVFRPFEKDTKKGYALVDDSNRILYYAVRDGHDGNCDVYRFKNRITKFSSTHLVSDMLRNNNAPNFSRKSFYYDYEEIWRHLKKQGIVLQTTIVNDELTQYKIKKYSKIIAFARKKKETEKQYSMRTYEKRIDLLFLTLFAIALTEEKHGNKAES